MNKLEYNLPATKSISRITLSGKITKTCAEELGHQLVPGLDSDYCPICNVYWVEERAIEEIRESKKKGRKK